LKTDNFLVVAAGGIVMYTADADVIAQIVNRDTDFPKAVVLSKPLDLYGPNILTAEGAAWRRHRRVTSQAFTEKNNELVWKETLLQTQTMVSSWTTGVDGEPKTLPNMAEDTMRLSLSVLSRALLGHSMDWSWGNDFGNNAKSEDKGNCHSMSFTNSLQFLLSHILYLMMVPRWLVRFIPNKTLSRCHEASDELRSYMREMVLAKRTAIDEKETSSDSPTLDILSNLIRSEANPSNEVSNGTIGSTSLTESEVIGNLFVFLIAGHETSANSIHFSLLLLAIHPSTQRKVQQDIDRILEGRTPSDLDYKRDFPRLLNSLLGAVLQEQLRLITPVLSIPKQVGSKPQTLIVNKNEIHVPPKTIIRLSVQAVHRNPRFWPNSTSNDRTKSYFPPSNPENDLEEFKPERWLRTGSQSPGSQSPATTPPLENLTTPNKLYSPPRGAYLPFSVGPRPCLGQKFANVEIMCALAVILSQYSVELAVDDVASDEEVAQMSKAEKMRTWAKARDAADKVWQQKMQCMLTLQIRGGAVPLRVVRRHSERFSDVED